MHAQQVPIRTLVHCLDAKGVRMTHRRSPRPLARCFGRCAWFVGTAGMVLAGCSATSLAQSPAAASERGAGDNAAMGSLADTGPSYPELLQLAEAAEIAVIVEIADQAVVKAERAPGLEAGKTRLYLEAETETLLSGPGVIGQSLTFLADRDLDARGRAPDLKKQRYVLFARTVPGRPGELQLVRPTAMQPASPATVERARVVLRQLAEAPALPEITGVREAISITGNLAGESETQMFLATQDGAPVSLNVIRRPGMEPEWGVSWSEIVDQSAAAPQPETIGWFRLACSLPDELPDEAFLQDDGTSRARAREDYAFILKDLGPCDRGVG